VQTNFAVPAIGETSTDSMILHVTSWVINTVKDNE